MACACWRRTMFAKLKENRARAAEQAALREQFKRRVKAALGLSDEDAVAVNEIACLDPGCPDVETVVLIMRAGHKTWAIKIPGPMAQVRDVDLVQFAQVAANS